MSDTNHRDDQNQEETPKQHEQDFSCRRSRRFGGGAKGTQGVFYPHAGR